MTVAAYPGYLLFFLMLFVPATYQIVKLVLLLTVLAIMTVRLMGSYRLQIHPVVLLWTLFYLCLGVGFIFRGFSNGAPGALRVSTVYLFWPIVFSYFIAAGINEKILCSLVRIMVVSTIMISLYGFSFVLNALGWIPEYLYLPIDQYQRFGFADGTVEASMYTLDSLLFLVPFCLSMLMTWPKDNPAPVSRRLLWIATIMGIAMVLLSGRRALMLVVVVSPLIAFTFQWFLSDTVRWKSLLIPLKIGVPLVLLFVTIIIYLQKALGFSLLSTVEMIGQGFQFDSYTPAMLRKEQFVALLECWSETPWFGNGLGATCAGSIRSVEAPWAYELSYLALLFHTGIFGFIAYASGTVWIFVKGLQLIRSEASLGLMMLPVLVGLSAFLIGNATNPYLSKFDSLWTIFFPVAILNHWLLQTKSKFPNGTQIGEVPVPCPLRPWTY